MIAYIADHMLLAREALTSKMRSYPLVEPVLDAVLEPVQDLEDVFFDLALSLSINGSGIWLDYIGKWLIEPRDGLKDDEYSRVLKYSWMSRNEVSGDYTHGTKEHIVTMVRGLTDAIKVSYVHNPPRGFWLTYVVEAPLGDAFKIRIAQMVNRAAPGGHHNLVAEAVLPYANSGDPDGTSYNIAPIAEAIII